MKEQYQIDTMVKRPLRPGQMVFVLARIRSIDANGTINVMIADKTGLAATVRKHDPDLYAIVGEVE
jgi:hypothetical protein